MFWNYLKKFINEFLYLYNEMAFYLIVGFLFAGIIKYFLSTDRIAKHLKSNNLLSVIKAAIFGIPLPLCSCGVLPAAITLRKEGASKGATTAFLISTPTTGVDSIIATYSILGLLFAVYRPLTALITGIIAGMIVNFFFEKNYKNNRIKNSKNSITAIDNEKQNTESSSCCCCHSTAKQENNEITVTTNLPEQEFSKVQTCCQSQTKEKTAHNASNNKLKKIKEILNYSFFELIDEIKNYLVLGFIIAAIISVAIPQNLFVKYLDNQFLSMIIMILVGIPLYICATGSIPITASLILKGLSPGAAFVFLFVGPATNAVSLTVLYKELGKKGIIIYLTTLIICSLFFGILLNQFPNVSTDLTTFLNQKRMQMHHNIFDFKNIIKIISSIILFFFILSAYFKKILPKNND